MTSHCSQGPTRSVGSRPHPSLGRAEKVPACSRMDAESMLYLPKERGESREVLEQLSDIPMTLSVDKGMGSGRATNPHPWGTPHTDSSHPQVTSKPFPTSVKPPLLRTVRPSSLCHSHLKQDPGTLQCSCPTSVQLHTPCFVSLLLLAWHSSASQALCQSSPWPTLQTQPRHRLLQGAFLNLAAG